MFAERTSPLTALPVQARETGFSLIELMIVMALLAALMTVGAPGLNDLIQSNRMATQTNDVVSMLTYTRGEALRRGARVSICPSSDGASCSGSDWGIGLVVFADLNRDGSLGAGEEILRTLPALAGGATLSAGGGISNVIQFRGTGVAMFSGTLTLCDSRPDQGRRIEIFQTGRISTTRGVTCS